MKYYIIKPKSHKVDSRIVCRIREVFKNAEEVYDLHDADEVILQKGWTRSKTAVAEYHNAKQNHIPCIEAYVYRDKFVVHLN